MILFWKERINGLRAFLFYYKFGSPPMPSWDEYWYVHDFLGNTQAQHLGEGKGIEGSRIGQRKLGYKAISRTFSADFMGRSETGMLFHIAAKGLDIYVSVLTSHWIQTAPRKEVWPGVRRYFQLKQFLERGDSWELAATVLSRASVLQSCRKICGAHQAFSSPGYGGTPEPSVLDWASKWETGWEECIFSRRF